MIRWPNPLLSPQVARPKGGLRRKSDGLDDQDHRTGCGGAYAPGKLQGRQRRCRVLEAQREGACAPRRGDRERPLHHGTAHRRRARRGRDGPKRCRRTLTAQEVARRPSCRGPGFEPGDRFGHGAATRGLALCRCDPGRERTRPGSSPCEGRRVHGDPVCTRAAARRANSVGRPLVLHRLRGP